MSNNGNAPWGNYLSARGVTDETARTYGVRLIERPTADEIKKLINFTPQKMPEAVIVFPNYTLSFGNQPIRTGAALRCFPPDVYEGRERKFLFSRGAGYRPYILPAVWVGSAKLDVPLFIVEKQTAALLLEQNGFAGIALNGTWGASHPKAELEDGAKRVLHHDLRRFSLVGREVYLCFDTDFQVRESVLEGLIRTFILFVLSGARVKVLQWSSEHKGLDDFISHTAQLNLEEQKKAIHTLVEPVHSLNVKDAAATWITPEYRPLFDREGSVIEMSHSGKNSLAHYLSKPLRVSVGSLEKTWGDTTGEIDTQILTPLEPWGEPVDGLALAEEVAGIFRRHSFLQKEEIWALTCWVFLTALMEEVTLLPMVAITSPVKRCGKTTLLGVLRRLCSKALPASAITTAGVYRVVDKYMPTLLIDELDTFLPENEALRGILNSGHTRDTAFKILVNPNTLEPERFSTFCPKAIAMIGDMPDTIEDRAINIKVLRKPPGVKLQKAHSLPANVYDDTARKVSRWGGDNVREVLTSDEFLPDGLNDRAAENWGILSQIAVVLGGEWPTRIKQSAARIGGDDDAEKRLLGIYLLSSLRVIFKGVGAHLKGSDEDTLLETTTLCETLNEDVEAPWADWGKGDRKGLTPKKLGGELRKFGIKSISTKVNNKPVRGFWWSHLSPVFDRYLGNDEPPPDDREPPQPDEPPSQGGNPTGGKNPESAAPETPPAADQNTKMGIEGDPLPQKMASMRCYEGKSLEPNDLPAADCSKTPPSKGVKISQCAADKSFSRNNLQQQQRIEGNFGGGGVLSPPFSLLFAAEEVDTFRVGLPDDLAEVALDTETFVPGGVATPSRKGDPKKGTALDWQVARIRLISLTVAGAEPVVINLGVDPDPETPIRRAVRRLLERLEKVEIVGHRLGFDLCFLEHKFGWRPSQVWDTWIAEELLLNDDWELCDKARRPKKVVPGPASLESALKRRCDIVLDKGIGGGALSDFGADHLLDEQYAYSAGDTRHLFALEAAQQLEIAASGMERIAEIEMSLVPIMSHLEIVGIPLRADILIIELAELQGRVAQLDAEILPAMQAVGFDPYLEYSAKSGNYLQPSRKTKPVNLNGNNLKQHYFRGLEKRLSLKMPRTESGLISITLDSLRGLQDPVARLYFTRGEYTALEGGITQRLPFIGPDGRVHPAHDQLSANTGRISTSEPPMSNLPKVIKGSPLRRGVEASAGYVLEQGDLSLIEVRAQAHFTGDPLMVELFNLPPGDPRGDIYRLFASWAHQCDILDIPAKGEKRNQAKPPVLGTAYLMGLERFVEYARGYGVELTVPRAAELRALYLKKFAGIKAWQDRAWANAKANRVTEGRSHLGRRRLVLKIPGDTSHQYRQAQAQVNYIIQAACADGLKIAIALIVEALPEGAELILTIHDELLVLCRIEQAQEVSKIVTEKVVMGYQEALGEPLKVPIVFETNVIQNWSEK